VVSRFVRKVRTALGAVAVQVVTRRGPQVEQFEHLGSAHTNAELALLLTAARARVSPGQDALDLGDLASVPVRMDDVAVWPPWRAARRCRSGVRNSGRTSPCGLTDDDHDRPYAARRRPAAPR